MRTITKDQYEQYLNEIQVPFEDLKSNGGRIPDDSNYGTWTRRNDPIAFSVGFSEWAREIRFRSN